MTRKTSFCLLLDDRYAPITSSIGFLKMDCARVVEAFETWHRDLYKPGGLAEQARAQLMKSAVSTLGAPLGSVTGTGPAIKTSNVAGPLSHALEALPPLTMGSNRRYLLVPTAGLWTAYFDNSKLGTDTSGIMPYLARTMKCHALHVNATPDSMGTKSLYDSTRQGRYGACMFELFGPDQTEWLNVVRVVSAMNDGGRWRFDASGTPQPYEEPETYKARLVRDKFPFALLDRYCRALGLRPFDDGFYLPPERPTAALFEVVYPHGPRAKEFTLAEVQAEWKQ